MLTLPIRHHQAQIFLHQPPKGLQRLAPVKAHPHPIRAARSISPYRIARITGQLGQHQVINLNRRLLGLRQQPLDRGIPCQQPVALGHLRAKHLIAQQPRVAFHRQQSGHPR